MGYDRHHGSRPGGSRRNPERKRRAGSVQGRLLACARGSVVRRGGDGAERVLPAARPSSTGVPRPGLTLVEILVVVAIIGILIAAVGLAGSHFREKGKRELTRQVMESVTNAIDEFRQAPPKPVRLENGWPIAPNWPNLPPSGDWRPVETLDPAVDLSYPTAASPLPAGTLFEANAVFDHPVRSIEGLHVYLGSVPGAKALLDKLPPSALRNLHAEEGEVHTVRPAGSNLPFTDPFSIVDGWKNPMRYRRYDYRNNGRPILWSAGPDGKFAADPNNPQADPNGRDDMFSDRND